MEQKVLWTGSKHVTFCSPSPKPYPLRVHYGSKAHQQGAAERQHGTATHRARSEEAATCTCLRSVLCTCSIKCASEWFSARFQVCFHWSTDEGLKWLCKYSNYVNGEDWSSGWECKWEPVILHLVREVFFFWNTLFRNTSISTQISTNIPRTWAVG